MFILGEFLILNIFVKEKKVNLKNLYIDYYRLY